LLDALAQLRLRLLDLTGRNRLLNFKHAVGKSIQFVEGQPDAIYQKLVVGSGKSSITILALPEPARRDWVERNGRLARPDPREWAVKQGISTSYDLQTMEGAEEEFNVRSLMYPDDLAKHCRKIQRDAELAIEETGANMLFLVLAFLEFPDQLDSDRTFTAPLVSIPVLMTKREVGGHQVFSLQFTGDDISENLSLREKLKADFNLILPEWDEETTDINAYLGAVQKITKSRPGFVFRNRVSLALISFTNMLLVRDLDPSKWPSVGDQHSLLDHEIIRAVFEGSSREEESGLDSADDYAVEEGPGANIPLVYDADSSQHSALIDVLINRKNLVIEGPPGTGKSQTITNLIAACLAEGKKVLFVAEKLAALEVVKNRLSLAGLDSFVLELHSNKTNKGRVLEEIAARLSYRPTFPRDLPQKLQELEAHRSELKEHAELINSVINNSFGLTLHQLMWRAEKHRLRIAGGETTLAQIVISDAEEISGNELSRRMDCLRHLGAQYQAIGGFDYYSTFWGFFPERIIPGDEIKLERLFTSSCDWAPDFVEHASAYECLLGGNVEGLNAHYAKTHLDILEQFLKSAVDTHPIHLVPGFFKDDTAGVRARRLLEAFSVLIERYHELGVIAFAGLRREGAAEQSRLESLKELDRLMLSVATRLGTSSQIKNFFDQLSAEVDHLNRAISASRLFCEERGIPFDGMRTNLTYATELSHLVKDIPAEIIHLQSPGLIREGCIPCLEALSGMQLQWTELQTELAADFYLDALPNELDLKECILTFREGDAWYRIFQSRWRDAVALHRRLQRRKQRVSAEDRQGQLERILNFVQLGNRWRSDPTWLRYLGMPVPLDPLPLAEHLELARWNRALTRSQEDLQTQTFDLLELTPERARILRRDYAVLNTNLLIVTNALASIDGMLPKLAEGRGGQGIQNCLEVAAVIVQSIGVQLAWLEDEVPTGVSFSDCLAACEAAIERRQIAAAVDADAAIKELLGDCFKGMDTDTGAALGALRFGESIDGLELPFQIRKKLKAEHPVQAGKAVISNLRLVMVGLRHIEALTLELDSFGGFDLATWVGLEPGDSVKEFARSFKETCEAAVRDINLLIPWSLYVSRRREAGGLGLNDFVDLVESKQVTPETLPDSYAYCTYTTIIRSSFRNIPQLGQFSGLKHRQIRNDFKKLDLEIIQLRGKSISAQSHSSARPPNGRNGVKVDEKTEMVLLNHLLPQRRPRMPVRKMLSRAGGAIQALKPCFMMGPQAVAQYLTPGKMGFDLVIMDEASQLKPEEAIGAIARGGQLVVVGDPKQLPPTSFFYRMSQPGEDDEQYTMTDAESILDVCSAHFRPPRALRWHYRSQHHSLIAFSNLHFYRSNLIVFPSPYGQSSLLGVRATYLADAAYENQTNLKEASRVVEAVIERITKRPNESLGIVTLNIKQRDLIAELLDERLKTVRGADEYRERWAAEGWPLFIKNLENVQGDERDAIIISTTFGKPPGSNSVRQNFGPISRQGGWRRLNVLFTRARRSIAIYTSLRPEDIVMDGTTPDGTKALRNYLEYARTGSLTVAEETDREPDSDFEVAVIDVLRHAGYEVTPQLGVAGYRIDIAVKHPDAPGTYLAAVECDGATYHSACSVRDRDRIRQDILESLGWKNRIWRIWSTDWFRMPDRESKKLISYLEVLRETWRPEHSAGASWVEEGVSTAERSASQSAGAEERNIIGQMLLPTAENMEVQVGDVVCYVDIRKPEDVLTVSITQKATDIANGLIAAATPLAQTLIGSVVGDEVSLHIPGASPKVFRILEIKK